MLLMLVISTSSVVAQHHRKTKSAKAKAHKLQAEDENETAKAEPLKEGEILLKLVDGTSVRVANARENEQGIWHTQGGVTYLIPRERIKTVEKGSVPKAAADASAASNTWPSVSQKTLPIQPVWIYLVGGARVEADSANESSAGVWYQRGPLNIFIERSRIDRIEREDLESTAKSDSSNKVRGWTTGNTKLDALIKQNGAKHGVDPYLVFCVMEQESHFSARAVSPKGARGLMQLMPGTGARFGVRNPFNPGENIAGGTRYLKQLLNQFNGRVDLVLASYNAGERAVVKYGHKVPPYPETRDYVRRISYRYQGTRKQVAAHHNLRAYAPALER